MAEAPNLQIIYVTGYNATGKTTLSQQIAEKLADQGWHFIDGDDFRKANPELEQSIIDACQKVMDKMRGTLGNENLVEEVRQHAAEVQDAWEPHFIGLFHKLKEEMVATGKHKLVFPYHCYQSWTLDLLRETFPGGPNNCKVVEVEVTRDLMKERFVQREVKAGMDHEKQWREDEGQRFKTCRERYGPEYRGNEENYKNFLEWRMMFPREEILADEAAGVYVINNDNFQAAQQLEKILNHEKPEKRMGRLIFVSGTPGAGKTTIGEGLKRENGFVHFDGDVWSFGLTGFDAVEHSGQQPTPEQMESEPLGDVQSLYRACFEDYWQKRMRSESPDLSKAEAFCEAMAADVQKRRGSDLADRDLVITNTVIERRVRGFLRQQFGTELEFVHLDVAPGLLKRRVGGRLEKQAASDGKSLEQYVIDSDHLFPPHVKTLDQRMEALTQNRSPPVEAIAVDELRTVSITVTGDMDASAVLVDVQRCLGL